MEDKKKRFFKNKWVKIIQKLIPHILTASIAIFAIVYSKNTANRQLEIADKQLVLADRQFEYFEKNDKINKGYYWFRLHKTLFELKEVTSHPFGYVGLNSYSEERKIEISQKVYELLISEIDNPLIAENPDYFESWRQSIFFARRYDESIILKKPFSDFIGNILAHAFSLWEIRIPYQLNDSSSMNANNKK